MRLGIGNRRIFGTHTHLHIPYACSVIDLAGYMVPQKKRDDIIGLVWKSITRDVCMTIGF